MTTYTTRTEAIAHEIIAALPNTEDWDVDAIADDLLTTTGEGTEYRWTLRDDITEDQFWSTVAAHEINN